MASIFELKTAKGGTSWRAQVCILTNDNRRGRVSKVFSNRKLAEAWVKKKEQESRTVGVALPSKATCKSVGDLIQAYINDNSDNMGKTALSCLRILKDTDFADVLCSEFSAQDIVDLSRELAARTRKKNGEMVRISKSTVHNYLMHLSSVLAVAEINHRTPIDEFAMSKALRSLRKVKKVEKSNCRDRRPTLSELNRLLSYFSDPATRCECAPMIKIILFAIFSSRRLSEITRLRWADLDEDGKRVLVREMKHPKEKKRNNVWVTLPDRAFKIIMSMPRHSDTIFPFNPGSIGTAFSRACKKVGIVDLTFHDLRHEAISHYHELGLYPSEVQKISGHTSPAALARYNQFSRRGDIYSDWLWTDRACQPETPEELNARQKWSALNAQNARKRAARKAKASAKS